MNEPCELSHHPSLEESLKRLRILLVDDNHEFLELVTQWFSRHPWIEVVGRAYYGQAALDQVARLQPDLVLMDVAMPGMSGLETTRRMKQRPRAPHIVILTLYDIPQYRAEAQNAGADGYVAKSAFHTEIPRIIASVFPSLKIEQEEGASRKDAPAPLS